MGNMASEMEARMREDGIDPSQPGVVVPGAAPGTEGGPPAEPPVTPPAGASNTDTTPGGPPETVPYTRFKEVNDRYAELRPIEQLFELGYDADSLRQLAGFEQQYLRDPIGTWASLADRLDLPQELKDAIQAHTSASGETTPPGNDPKPGPSGGATTPTEPQRLELPPDVQQRLDYVDQLRAREDEAARERTLSTLTAKWDEMDKKAGITTPEKTKLTYIAQTAAAGREFRTFDEFVEAARREALEYRESVLGSAIVPGTGGRTPLAVPGGTPAATPPTKFKDFREASRAAEADLIAGRLPPLNPGA